MHIVTQKKDWMDESAERRMDGCIFPECIDA